MQHRIKSVISGTYVVFHNIGHMIICNCSFFISMYLLPVKTEKDLREINNVTEITNLLRYWSMLEIFDGMKLEAHYLESF